MDKDLLYRANELLAKLDPEHLRKEIREFEAASMHPDFWKDHVDATQKMKKISELQKELAAAEDFVSLIELGDEEMLVREIKKMEFSLYLSGPYDKGDAILSLHSGQGGTEAMDWTQMLHRMYSRYLEKKGWEWEEMDVTYGEEAGLKSISVEVHGKYAYGFLKAEAGVHRLVRQSPFNSDALRQTSFALVEVLPELGEAVDVEIRAEDLRIDTFMSGGKGGQSVNTTYSAVRIVHLPTKITVSCQNERSQMQNKETAMRILKSRLQLVKDEALQKEKLQLRGEHQSAEWGSQIRSYVLHPYKMVKDHRTEVETSNPEAVLDGDLDAFVEGYLRWKATSSKED